MKRLDFFKRLMLGSMGCMAISLIPAQSVKELKNESTIFKAYQKNWKDCILPNFSYVGYHNGDIGIPENKQLKQFNVLDFGAIPNDDISDKKAIQSAIDAASKNGGGVVFFPKGRFLANEDNDDYQAPIVIPSCTTFCGCRSSLQ